LTHEVLRRRWPTGAKKVGIYDGAALFSGDFDERDVEIAQRAYPGRRVVLTASGDIEIYPRGSTKTIHELFLDNQRQPS
jgi:hypothetical protein